MSASTAEDAIPQEFLAELFSSLRSGKRSRGEVSSLKMALASKHRLRRVPRDYELLLSSPEEPSIRDQLRMKPTRTRSGVAVVAAMASPRACPHGKCAMCPGGPFSAFGDVPQSYTGREPASMRASRNSYDAYLQVFNRLMQYVLLGHEPGKVELIAMGGTFPAAPEEYQEQFVSDALAAMNDFSERFYPGGKLDERGFSRFFTLGVPREDRLATVQKAALASRRQAAASSSKNLAEEQERNESARIRCVALCVETRPDWAGQPQIGQMLSLGTTRVEVGVQSLSDEALRRIGRGHTVEDSARATALLKDAFLKVGYHIMPGLPGSTPESDREMFRILFADQSFKPDALKIYPCLVMEGTPLAEDFRKGAYAPLSVEAAAGLIADAKASIPEYCRVMRIQRDIPSTAVLAGPTCTNLRQKVHEELSRRGERCRCLRCREPGSRQPDFSSSAVVRRTYEASGGTEMFISFEERRNNIVLGYCRLRLPGEPSRPEITQRTAGVRELHVFGRATPLGEQGAVQHHGIGSLLLEEAERAASDELDASRLLVTAGIGVRPYYLRKGYRREGPYVGKTLK